MESTKQKYIALLKDAKIDMEKTSILTKSWDKVAIKHNIYTSVVKDLEQLENPWISVEDELPEDQQYVYIYAGNYQQGMKYAVVRFCRGITIEERDQMKADETRELIREPMKPVRYALGGSPRWNCYYGCDEQSNNLKPYNWETFGPMSYFGQYATYWMPLIEPPTKTI